ncbi:uncharacterized protein SAPINGB_P001650 [Magnusiomyces paraingens]|uniref:F-box domain-containing protein n=1 Tax=Magnusiomyces paraingens TaxID=2606893 RepID=A0A5E8B8Y2_9ASCO|nr:uncharacterized protein SAPINGB_P001650 [Saprochaete ingens]VVT47315.1 unnamed protein product [Saprochaete ingens]
MNHPTSIADLLNHPLPPLKESLPSTPLQDSSTPSTPTASSSTSPQPVLFNHNKPVINTRVPENRMKKYCYRHHPEVSCNRQADANQMTEIQGDIDKLSDVDRTAISHVWSIFSAAPASQRSLILKGLLAQCCFPQLSQVSSMLDNLIRIDFLSALPPEISFKILSYLDSTSLCRAAQVSKKWKQLADDDIVWHRMCEQHINKKCTKCGWGLPLLEKKRLHDSKRAIEARLKAMNEGAATINDHGKRPNESTSSSSEIQTKKRRTRPWKDVYKERYCIEANWRNGRYRTLTFEHPSPVLCLQFDEQYLITGTYDGLVSIWDVETGKLVRTLKGHLSAISALKFDNLKLITASRDTTVRVWDYRKGDCVCTFRGHEGPVLCIDCDQRLIASGSADNNIKVWNFTTKTCFTLRGHTDWVQSVRVHSASGTLYSGSQDATIRMWDLVTKNCIRVFSQPGSEGSHVAQIQSVIPLYIDHLQGDEHGCSVPPRRNLARPHQPATTSSQESEDSGALSPNSSRRQLSEERQTFDDSVSRRSFSTLDSNNQPTVRPSFYTPPRSSDPFSVEERTRRMNARPTHILSASLDSTIKMWDVNTGACVRTFFGHIEGIWGIAADNFRVVSGSHDKLVKVWDLQSGRNWHTFNDHTSHVTSVCLSDTRLASGSDDGMVRMLCFDDFEGEKDEEAASASASTSTSSSSTPAATTTTETSEAGPSNA